MSKTNSAPPGTPGQPPSMQQIKAGMRATWMSGDFAKIAEHMEGIAEDFARRVAPGVGARVLDVACGSGNITLPLARMGADVTGVDVAPNLLETARERARLASLNIAFDEGDAEALPYKSGSFDVVVSMFGAMFAPQPELVTNELARVLKPGGVLAMANWTPGSFTGDIFQTTGKHVPPAHGLQSPLLWGEEKTVAARLADGFRDVKTAVMPVDFDFPLSPQQVSALFREYYGPTRTAFSKLNEESQHALRSDLDALWSAAAVPGTPANQTLVHNEYLYVVATRVW